jgi:hypothetical protein
LGERRTAGSRCGNTLEKEGGGSQNWQRVLDGNTEENHEGQRDGRKKIR